VSLVELDQRSGDWPTSIPAGDFDAVVWATTLRWSSPEKLVVVYTSLAQRLRPGGLVASTPRFRELLAERNRRFQGSLHPSGFRCASDWHREQLTAMGFPKAEVVWRRGPDAVMAGLR
jgi:hypothetical protein